MFAADGLLKSPLKLIGAKTGIEKNSARRRIYDLIPDGTRTYIEPFLGSGGILIGKKPHAVEHVNDLNWWAINFFRCLQDRPWDVFEAANVLSSTMSQEWYNELRANMPPRDDLIACAAWYYVIDKWARNGIVRFRKRDGGCNSTYCKEDDGRGVWDSIWLQCVYDRIQGVHFHQLDWEEFLWKHRRELASPDTFIILDPPYSRVFTAYNGGDRFSDSVHEVMATLLKGLKCKWLLTINDNEYIRELYSFAHCLDNPIRWQCSNTNKGRRVEIELMFANYPITRDRQLSLFDGVGA